VTVVHLVVSRVDGDDFVVQENGFFCALPMDPTRTDIVCNRLSEP
jgi:hypothetical protein